MGTDDKPQARLCLMDDDGIWSVYDSRDGNAVEYEIRSQTARVLRILEKPLSVEEIRRELENPADLDLSQEMALLKEKGLVFEEEGRYLALI